jgi:nicotinamidase-related amidase
VAKVRNGNALILIDIQEGFRDPIWGKRNNPNLESNVEVLLTHWRKNKWPIYHVQHLSRNPNSPLHASHSGVEFMECAKPLLTEVIIQKSVNSCFIGTTLESQLRGRKIQNLVFIGIASDHCVSTSTRMAANLGFDCTVISDATATFDRTGYDGVIYPADLVRAVNLASLHAEFATVIDMRGLLEASDE